MNSYFFQSLSWLFQLAYFVKCKQRLLELNFYQPYPSSWGEWTLSLLVYVLNKRKIRHFHGYSCSWRQRNIQKIAMHVQSCCFILSSINAYLTFSSPHHQLKLPIIYDTLWSVRNRIFPGQIRSSVVSLFLVRKVENKVSLARTAWWTNRASVARQ